MRVAHAHAHTLYPTVHRARMMIATPTTRRQGLLCLCAVLLLSLSPADAEGAGEALSAVDAAKCIIPNGLSHLTRATLLQQCLSNNYGQGNETQCFGELGCFSVDRPWTTLTRPFPTPQSPSVMNVRLYCYSSTSPERQNVTLWPNVTLQGCPIGPNSSLVFLVHGFASNGNNSWMMDFKDRYLKAKKDVTVLIVDWGKGAQQLNYLQVASNTRVVGALLARFLKIMQKESGLRMEKVHMLGHSLGAHICGYVGKEVKHIARISGMDPAQPGFDTDAPEVRLQKTDAKFVDVIHTNSLPFIPSLGFGTMVPTGDADFYMNGGLQQPGCHIPNVTIRSIEDLANVPVEVLSMWVSCSHGRAYEYFLNALDDNCTIWGRTATVPRHILNAVTLGHIDPLFSSVKKCSKTTCSPLGLHTPDFEARGVFAASTHRSAPYCDDDPERNQRVLLEVEKGDSSENPVGTLQLSAVKPVDVASKLPKNIGGLLGIPHI